MKLHHTRLLIMSTLTQNTPASIQLLLKAAAVTLLLQASPLHGQIISNNFNALITGSNLGAPWTVTGTTVDQTVTIADVESPFTAIVGGKSVFLQDTDSTATGDAAFRQTFTSYTSSTDGLNIQFDFQVPSSNTPAYIFSVNNSSSGQGFFMEFTVSNIGGGFDISYRGSSGGAGIQTTLASNLDRSLWYNVAISTTPPGLTGDQFSLSVTPFGGSALTANNNLFRNELANIGEISFTSRNGQGFAGNFYVDNVLVSAIPEPGSVGLLLMGALSLALRRMRRRVVAG